MKELNDGERRKVIEVLSDIIADYEAVKKLKPQMATAAWVSIDNGRKLLSELTR